MEREDKRRIGGLWHAAPYLTDPSNIYQYKSQKNPQDQHLFDQPTVKQYATTWWPAGRLVRQPINTQSKGWDVDEHTQRPLKAVQCPVTETLHSGGEAHNLSAEKHRCILAFMLRHRTLWIHSLNGFLFIKPSIRAASSMLKFSSSPVPHILFWQFEPQDFD